MRYLIQLTVFFLSFNLFAQVAEKAEDITPLMIGEKIPNEIVKDINGKNIQTENIFSKPTILAVYRGGWCPYCNAHLSALGEIETEIMKLGYQIVGVSPDNLKKINKSDNKHELNYQLLSDPKGNLIRKMGLAFKAPKVYGPILAKENEDKFIPVPAIFVINDKNEIEFTYISINYKKRMSKELLMAVLRNLNR